MATEVLYIPEEELEDVIRVIREGLKVTEVSATVVDELTIWCDEEERYLKAMRARNEE